MDSWRFNRKPGRPGVHHSAAQIGMKSLLPTVNYTPGRKSRAGQGLGRPERPGSWLAPMLPEDSLLNAWASAGIRGATRAPSGDALRRGHAQGARRGARSRHLSPEVQRGSARRRFGYGHRGKHRRIAGHGRSRHCDWVSCLRPKAPSRSGGGRVQRISLATGARGRTDAPRRRGREPRGDPFPVRRERCPQGAQQAGAREEHRRKIAEQSHDWYGHARTRGHHPRRASGAGCHRPSGR